MPWSVPRWTASTAHRHPVGITAAAAHSACTRINEPSGWRSAMAARATPAAIASSWRSRRASAATRSAWSSMWPSAVSRAAATCRAIAGTSRITRIAVARAYSP